MKKRGLSGWAYLAGVIILVITFILILTFMGKINLKKLFQNSLPDIQPPEAGLVDFYITTDENGNQIKTVSIATITAKNPCEWDICRNVIYKDGTASGFFIDYSDNPKTLQIEYFWEDTIMGEIINENGKMIVVLNENFKATCEEKNSDEVNCARIFNQIDRAEFVKEGYFTKKEIIKKKDE